jgi:uncharacterized protein YeaO (DUF488 family)
MQVHIKRIYEQPSPSDGFRVLVDRLWPRGVTKADAAIDMWAKDLAPSSQLRQWFGHEKTKFAEFARRYRLELGNRSAEINKLVSSASSAVTLLYAARDAECNHAVVLQAWLESIDA